MKQGQKFIVKETSLQFDKDEVVICKRETNNKNICIVERSNGQEYAIHVDSLKPLERFPQPDTIDKSY